MDIIICCRRKSRSPSSAGLSYRTTDTPRTVPVQSSRHRRTRRRARLDTMTDTAADTSLAGAADTARWDMAADWLAGTVGRNAVLERLDSLRCSFQALIRK